MTDGQYEARFWRYQTEDSEECDTLEEAVAYLASGWARGELSEIDVAGPDGSAVLSGDALHKRMMAVLGV